MTAAMTLLLSATGFAQEPVALSLEQAMAVAIERNPGLTVARAAVDEAVADRTVAQARLLPRVSGTASAVWLEPDRLSPLSLTGLPSAPTLYAEEEYVGLTARQAVFDGSVFPAITASRRGIDAATHGRVASEAEARFNVTVAFTRLLVADAMVGVAEGTLARQKAFEGLITRLSSVDKATRLDLLRAQAQRLEAERNVVASTESRAVAEAQLRRTLGVEPDFPLHIVGDLQQMTGEPPEAESLLSDAASHSPALAQQDARREQAESSVRAAWGEHLPDVSIVASYGYRNRDIGGGADEYVLGLYVDWPLFAGLGTDGQVDRARARAAAASAGHAGIEDQLRVDVRSALADWRIALAAVTAARGAVATNTEAVEAAAAMFEEGRTTSLDVLTAQSDLARSEAALLQALGDIAIARAKVERLTGRPLS